MAGDDGGEAKRYQHLLQPIKDLATNWGVDIASELEHYLGELSEIEISFDGGNTSLNFAQAALVIQGSAQIYSRKVEYLYSLIYQTLDMITTQAKKKKVWGAAAPPVVCVCVYLCVSRRRWTRFDTGLDDACLGVRPLGVDTANLANLCTSSRNAGTRAHTLHHSKRVWYNIPVPSLVASQVLLCTTLTFCL